MVKRLNSDPQTHAPLPQFLTFLTSDLHKRFLTWQVRNPHFAKNALPH